jgi:hypothetical protein
LHPDPRQDLYSALDPATFARTRLDLVPDTWQERVLKSHAKRTLLNCSRQAGKSTVSAVLALHTSIYHPGSLVLLVSPTLRQSSELFRKTTELLERLSSPPKLLEVNKQSLSVQGGGRIVSLPGAEGNIRGYSAVTLLIEDEASRVPDELYRSVRPMLAVSGGRMLLMSTPWGKRGHFFEEWASDRAWQREMVPATACPRISPTFLEEEREALGEWWYRQEYLCDFVDGDDQLFTPEMVQAAISHDLLPLPPATVRASRSSCG